MDDGRPGSTLYLGQNGAHKTSEDFQWQYNECPLENIQNSQQSQLELAKRIYWRGSYYKYPDWPTDPVEIQRDREEYLAEDHRELLGTDGPHPCVPWLTAEGCLHPDWEEDMAIVAAHLLGLQTKSTQDEEDVPTKIPVRKNGKSSICDSGYESVRTSTPILMPTPVPHSQPTRLRHDHYVPECQPDPDAPESVPPTWFSVSGNSWSQKTVAAREVLGTSSPESNFDDMASKGVGSHSRNDAAAPDMLASKAMSNSVGNDILSNLMRRVQHLVELTAPASPTSTRCSQSPLVVSGPEVTIPATPESVDPDSEGESAEFSNVESAGYQKCTILFAGDSGVLADISFDATGQASQSSSSGNSRKRPAEESDTGQTSSGQGSQTKRGRRAIDGNDTSNKGRFPCIFHVGQPDAYGHDTVKYEHISQLVRHLRGKHSWQICSRCFSVFETASELDRHRSNDIEQDKEACIRMCNLTSCRRWYRRTAVPTNGICECVQSSLEQWNLLFETRYPSGMVSMSWRDWMERRLQPNASDLLNGLTSAATASERHRIEEEHGMNGEQPKSPPPEALGGNQNALTSEQETLFSLQRQVALLEQRVSQPDKRQSDMEALLGLVWEALGESGSPKGRPGSRLHRMIGSLAPGVLTQENNSVGEVTIGSLPNHDAFVDWDFGAFSVEDSHAPFNFEAGG